MAVPTSDPDPNTDPGRPHPFESLYRSAAGEPVGPSRPTPRHFEPHLSRPDGAQEGFGWLYRDEVVAEPDVADADARPVPPQANPPAAPAAGIVHPAAPAVDPITPRRGRVLLVVLLVVLVGVVVAGLLTGGWPGWSSGTAPTDLVRRARTALGLV